MPTEFRLAELLAKRGMSQSELARRSGVSLPTINKMCRNRTGQVSLATLDAIAKTLKVAPGRLIARRARRSK